MPTIIYTCPVEFVPAFRAFASKKLGKIGQQQQNAGKNK